MKRGWFGPKVFGWGASPASWEGWLATLIFVLAMVGAMRFFAERPHGWIAPVAVIAVYIVTVILTYRRNARTWF